MVVLVCGLRGQHAVRRVGLVLSLEADPVITPPLMLEDKTAQGTSLRRKVVSLRHVLVSNHDLQKLYFQVKLKMEITMNSFPLICINHLWKSIKSKPVLFKKTCYYLGRNGNEMS